MTEKIKCLSVAVPYEFWHNAEPRRKAVKIFDENRVTEGLSLNNNGVMQLLIVVKDDEAKAKDYLDWIRKRSKWQKKWKGGDFSLNYTYLNF